MALKFFQRNRGADKQGKGLGKAKNAKAARDETLEAGLIPTQKPAIIPYDAAPAVPIDNDTLRGLYQQGRYCTILHNSDKWDDHPQAAEIMTHAVDRLEEQMAMVPGGSVNVSETLDAQPGAPEQEIDVEAFLLDMHAITNAQYQLFVDAGGYDSLEYWPEDIWPHLIEFKDLTDTAGPRYWRNGRHSQRLTDHPVVGISWYEAQAYALWVGKRLPSEAEWQMAASWAIKSSADILRRFPWGDSMDNKRCNIWSSRRYGTVPVFEYENGAAPNQIKQLVGNIWEWTDSPFSITDEEGNAIVGEMSMQSIRGAAFDTYFESQATANFRTGQIAIGRTHNTGFRCALSLEHAPWLDDEE